MRKMLILSALLSAISMSTLAATVVGVPNAVQGPGSCLATQFQVGNGGPRYFLYADGSQRYKDNYSMLLFATSGRSLTFDDSGAGAPVPPAGCNYSELIYVNKLQIGTFY